MTLPRSSTCVKYLLFVFNLIFLITGIAVLTVGSVVQSHYTKYYDILDERFFSVPALLIATGIIILTISFFGCCGAVKEIHWMIITFSVLLILIFILELAAGIAGYILEDVTVEVVANGLNTSMNKYNKDFTTREMWEVVQKEFSCCGIYNSTDWKKVNGSGGLPYTCCTFKNTDFGNFTCMDGSDNVHKTGCLEAIGDFIVQNAVALGGVGIGIAFVQFLGIILACCLAHSIRKHYETV
ncbi:CD63 antigen [Anabrus simplex]|uniref:CD63 antigen n=1 Tax=Anabrus simplex TaxID=316456 RepID=UPI0035A2BE97